jgi:hypothetical protein
VPIEVIAGTGTRGNPVDGAPAASALAPITAIGLAGDRLVFTQHNSIFELSKGALRQLFAGEMFATALAVHDREMLVLEPEARRMRSIENGRKPKMIASARTGIKAAWKQPWSFAEQGGAIFVADEDGDALWRIDREAKTVERFVDIQQPHCIAARGDELFVATSAIGVVRVDIASREVGMWLPMGSDREHEVIAPKAMVVAPDGAIWISDTDAIRRYDDRAKKLEPKLGTGAYPTSFDAECSDPLQLAIPTADCIAVDGNGVLYAALFSRILRVS